MRTIRVAAALLISVAGGALAAGTSAGGGTAEGQAATAAGSGQNQAAPATDAKSTVTIQQGECPAGQVRKAGGGCQP